MTMRAMVILQGLQVCRMYARKHKFSSNSKQMDLEKKSSLSTKGLLSAWQYMQLIGLRQICQQIIGQSIMLA